MLHGKVPPLEYEDWFKVSTATISDALDRLGLAGSTLGLRPLTDGQRLAGRAFTVRYVPAAPVPGSVGDYIDEVEPGMVVVLDNQGRTNCTVWGDILTEFSARSGVAGTVIWGACRDVAKALSIGYPIYTAGRFMRTGKDRVEVGDVGSTVALGDARIAPGDLVIGDDDGVVGVPAGYEEKVLEVATEIEALEGRILAEALSGGSLRAAREKYGYHELQRGGGRT